MKQIKSRSFRCTKGAGHGEGWLRKEEGAHNGMAGYEKYAFDSRVFIWHGGRRTKGWAWGGLAVVDCANHSHAAGVPSNKADTKGLGTVGYKGVGHWSAHTLAVDYCRHSVRNGGFHVSIKIGRVREG